MIDKQTVDIEVVRNLLIKPPLPTYDPQLFAYESFTSGVIMNNYHTSFLMKHKEPSLKKSITATRMIYNSMGNNQQISIDEINRRWNIYKSVSHLASAAIMVYMKNEHALSSNMKNHFSWFSILFSPIHFFEVLRIAETIRKFAEDYRPPRVNERFNNPVLIPGETWHTPSEWKLAPVKINPEKYYEGIKKWLTSGIKR